MINLQESQNDNPKELKSSSFCRFHVIQAQAETSSSWVSDKQHLISSEVLEIDELN